MAKGKDKPKKEVKKPAKPVKKSSASHSFTDSSDDFLINNSGQKPNRPLQRVVRV